MADADAQAKEQLAKSNKEKERSVEDAYAHGGTPTPTQEENDLAALGVHTDEHADDGSGPSPQFKMVNTAHETKQSEAHKPAGGGYSTRAAAPARETPKQQS